LAFYLFLFICFWTFTARDNFDAQRFLSRIYRTVPALIVYYGLGGGIASFLRRLRQKRLR
jgi:hypothetical protein